MRLARWHGVVSSAVAATAAIANANSAHAQASADSLPRGMLVQTLAITLPIAAAVIGYFIVYWNNWRLETRKAALRYVSDQLQFLYGPLFALNTAADRAVGELMRRRGARFFFEPGGHYSAADISEYRLWMSEVFMPINLKIETTITENAHLIDGSMLPDSFGEMLAHIASYKATIKTWGDNPPAAEVSYEDAVQQNTALLPYPAGFPAEVAEPFNRLKACQTRLLGIIGSNVQPASPGAAAANSTAAAPPPFDRNATRPARKVQAR